MAATTVTPWSSNIASFKTGPLPAMPPAPYSMLKGSICSLIAEPSPWDPAEQSLRFTCSDREMKAPTPSGRTPPSSSSNPGVMACGPQRQFTSGVVAYCRWRFLIPSEFPPVLPPGAFCLLGEFHGGVNVAGKEVWLPDQQTVKGSPFGSPATSLVLDLIGGQEMLCLARGYPTYDRIWKVPLVRDQVIQVIFGACFSRIRSRGGRSTSTAFSRSSPTARRSSSTIEPCTNARRFKGSRRPPTAPSRS